MNIRFKLAALMAVILISASSAFAAPKAREVEDAMRARNWSGAETMLQEVLKEKPKSAKAWYLLAQTQEQQRNTGAAQSSLAKARSLDPTLAFASPGAVEKMERRIGASGYAPTPSEPARAASRQRSAPNPYASEAPSVNPNAQLPSPSAASARSAPAPAPSSGHGALYAFLGLLALGGVGYYFYRKSSANKASAQQDTDRRALLGRAVAVQTRAAEIAKLARYEAPEGSAFAITAKSIASSADSALGRLKASGASTFSIRDEERKLAELESRVEKAENQGQRKAWTEEETIAAPSFDYASRSSGSSSNAFGSSGTPAAGPGYNGGGYNGGYQQPAPPQTVVVQNDNSSSLLTTMIMANALSSHHDHGSSSRERDLERQLDRERDRSDHYREPAPAYEAPAPAYEPAPLDFGGDTSGDGGWGNDSGSSGDSGSSVDTGGNDDF